MIIFNTIFHCLQVLKFKFCALERLIPSEKFCQFSEAWSFKAFYEARFLRSSASWQWDGENLVLLSQESFYYSQHFLKEVKLKKIIILEKRVLSYAET